VFGLFGDSAAVLGVASIGVIGIILWVEATSGVRSPLLTVALGLLIGGAVGNLVDRLRFGHVIDWVDTGVGSLRFYTFNVADSAISIAVALLLTMSLLGPRLGRLVGAPGTRTGSEHPVANGGHP
jgi:signal peptidase II